MKILMLTPWYPDDEQPHHGIFIQDQARALSAKHDVQVISSKVKYGVKKFYSYSVSIVEKNELPPEFQIRISQSYPVYNQFNHLYITIRESYKIAKAFKPDLIHASIGFPGAFWGWCLSVLLSVPFVFTEHTKVNNNFRSAFHRFLTISGLRRATFATTVSQSIANELRAFVRCPVFVVPNVVKVNSFKDVHLCNESTPQIGFLGGMNTNVKGLDVLLKALSKSNRKFIIHVGGTGLLYEQYRKMAEELGINKKCRFYGFIQPNDVVDFMSKIHFFVCSSRYETFCVSLVEAMASGRPVVSTPCGGPNDFVNDQNGILCGDFSEESLVNAIEEMMVRYPTFSSETIKKFAQRYSAENIADELTLIFNKAVKSRLN